MPLILPQYRYLALGLALVASHAVIGRGCTQMERTKWEAVVAKNEKALSDARDEHNRKVADLENKQIIEALEMQEQYNANMAALQADNDGSNDRITDLVRELRATSGRCKVPGETADTGGTTQPPTSGESELSERIGADFNRLGFAANSLAEYAKLCHQWATSVGR